MYLLYNGRQLTEHSTSASDPESNTATPTAISVVVTFIVTATVVGFFGMVLHMYFRNEHLTDT